MIASRWALPAHVHACVLDGDVVFLDLERNAYFSTANVADILSVEDDAETLILTDFGLADELRRGGLIVRREEAPPIARFKVSERRRDIGGQGLQTSDRLPARKFGRIAADAVTYFRRRHLGDLVRAFQAGAPQVAEARIDLDDLRSPTTAFLEALAFLPFQGECLYRAFLTGLHMRREGFPARLVFGVRTWPFFAHCWVQVGDVVVGDPIDRLVSYRPILAV